MVRELVTNPDAFFSRKVAQASLRLEILLVVLIGALNAVGLLYVVVKVLDVRDGADMRFVVIGRLLRPIILILLVWVGYTLVFHFAASHYRGRGPPSELLKGIAWALLPLGIGNLAQSAAFVLVLRDQNVSDLLVGFDSTAEIQALLESVMSDPIMLVATLFFAGTLLWSGYLMIYVVKHAKSITHENATRLVGGFVGIHLLAVLWAIVQGSPNVGLLL